MLERSITEAIYILRKLMDRSREKKFLRDLHMIHINLEEYDRTHREVMSNVIEKIMLTNDI